MEDCNTWVDDVLREAEVAYWCGQIERQRWNRLYKDLLDAYQDADDEISYREGDEDE